ncbi:hypothetical protein [Streptococcus equinus]|uniref:hypothetical protein n=1 Tax=Streptococcus equinus TaxID=1335 RepID=UPI0008EB16C6|nr:hypothetical protein [Streptococcus equinus]SFC09675.1 hypothetical protein SAMN05216408_0953 [Streptococcus equinus]
MKIIIPKQNFTTLYVTLTIIILATFSQINDNNTIIQYWDEIFTVFAAFKIVCGINAISSNYKKRQIFEVISVMLILIILVGLISNYYFHIASNNISILMDLFGLLKTPVIFVCTFLILTNEEKKSILFNMKNLAKIYVLSAFIFSLINLVINTSMTFDVRYGFRSFRFFYRNPGALNAAMLSAYSIISVTSHKTTRKIFLALTTIVIVLTFRGMGIGAVGVFIMLEVYTNLKKSNNEFSFKKLLPVSIIAFLLGYNQIEEYFIGSDSIRNLFLKNSIVILKRYFPIGSGFATYGSDQAYKNYSKLYYEFGYNNIYYLRPGNGIVANDNFWPMIIGQFGIFGFFAYISMILLQFKFVFSSKMDDKIKVIVISLLVFVFITSLGNAVYTSATGMLIYITAGVVYQPSIE